MELDEKVLIEIITNNFFTKKHDQKEFEENYKYILAYYEKASNKGSEYKILSIDILISYIQTNINLLRSTEELNIFNENCLNFAKLLNSKDMDIETNKFMLKLSFELGYESKRIEKILESERVLDCKINQFEKKLDKHTIDTLGITTLIFTAFTFLSVNVSILSAIFDPKRVDIDKLFYILLPVNVVIILSILIIYTIVRNISGKISKKEYYFTLVISFSLMTILPLLINYITRK